MLGGFALVDHLAHLDTDRGGVFRPPGLHLGGDLGEVGLGGGQQPLPVRFALGREQRVAAGDQPLPGIVGGADLGEVLGIVQRHLQRAAVGELADRRGSQAGDPGHARDLLERLDPGTGDHPAVAHHHRLGDAERAPHHLHGLDERLRVGGVAREDPHRRRPAVPGGEQPVFDLRLAPLVIAGVPERG